jgi:uncharacterized membrane-anchored protein YjiN (DUF445 family)
VDRYARVSLLVAAGVLLLGHLLGGESTLGGFVVALGEASLVGGLADWYAVRALFGAPLGIKWHTAIIPRNKERLVRQIRVLIIEQWLPPEVFEEKIRDVDLVERGLALIGSDAAREDLVRMAGEVVAETFDPEDLATLLSRPLAQQLQELNVAPHARNLVRRARKARWLDPLMGLWLQRLEAWAGTPRAETLVRQFLERLYRRYKEGSVLRRFLGKMGEALGAVDLDDLARSLRAEIIRFAGEQRLERSDLNELVDRFLSDIERKLADDQGFRERLNGRFREVVDAETLDRILWPILRSVRTELQRDLDSGKSRVVAWLMERVDHAVRRVNHDPDARERTNAWLRDHVTSFLRTHHGRIGDLVEDRLRAYSDAHLVEMIEDRIGDDLNWIRINGACVGGAIGVALHGLDLLFKG